MTDNSTTVAAAATTEESDADRTLIIERFFKTTPEKLFKAWTDPTILVKWWGPEGFEIPDCEMDVRTGGKWRTTMVSPEGKRHTVSGAYRELSPPGRLVLTWGWEEDGVRGHETVIELAFEPAAGGTRMRFVQSIFESAHVRDLHDQGWSSSFNDLGRLFGSS